MGSLWLVNIPDWLEDAGLPYRLYKGWETRARSSGGYDAIRGVGYHHDATSPSSNPASAEAYMWDNADSRPIGALYIRRDGSITVGAAGATNTMGKGGPLTTSQGSIPLDKGNQYMVAIEAANNGVGETWPKVMVDNYITLCAVLCDRLGLEASDCYSHWEYCNPSCPGRKIDPAGPTPSHPDIGGSTSAVNTWSTSAFRNRVATAMGHEPAPSPEPEPPPQPTPIDEEDRMLGLVRLDSNPNAIYVVDGINARLVRSDEVDELTSNLQYDTGFRYYDLTQASRPQIRDVNKIPKRTDDQIQLWGIETEESKTQPG